MNNKQLEKEVVYEVLSRKTGVPVDFIAKSLASPVGIEMIEQHLRKHVIGQDHAIDEVIQSLKSRNLRGLEERPMFCGLFTGPSGVGKTELALRLAEAINGTRGAVVRIDGSEYREPHTVSRLVGSPPGYIGYGQGGQLTEGVRRNRRCVVLFDEIEKASQEVQNILLQVMSAGYLTDATGNRVDFRHTMLIMTSNLGNQNANELGIFNESDSGEYQKIICRNVKRYFLPEFISRLDAIVVFNHLGEADGERIVTLKVEELAKSLENVKGIILTEDARKALAQESFDSVVGARKIDRIIRERVDQGIIALLEKCEKTLDQGMMVKIDINRDGDYIFAIEPV